MKPFYFYFLLYPEHGLRPLMYETDLLQHASHVAATRNQGAGSEARAWLLFFDHACRSQLYMTPHDAPDYNDTPRQTD